MSEETRTYPVLPLRDIVVFPHMVVPLFVGREKSVRALEVVMEAEREILLVAQKDASNDDPTEDDIYSVGVVAKVLQLLKLPDGTVKVLVEGGARAQIVSYLENEEFFDGFLKISIDNLKKNFFVEYSNLKFKSLKQICFSLGFDDIFTIHHIKHLENIENQFILIDDSLLPHFRL